MAAISATPATDPTTLPAIVAGGATLSLVFEPIVLFAAAELVAPGAPLPVAVTPPEPARKSLPEDALLLSPVELDRCDVINDDGSCDDDRCVVVEASRVAVLECFVSTTASVPLVLAVSVPVSDTEFEAAVDDAAAAVTESVPERVRESPEVVVPLVAIKLAKPVDSAVPDGVSAMGPLLVNVNELDNAVVLDGVVDEVSEKHTSVLRTLRALAIDIPLDVEVEDVNAAEVTAGLVSGTAACDVGVLVAVSVVDVEEELDSVAAAAVTTGLEEVVPDVSIVDEDMDVVEGAEVVGSAEVLVDVLETEFVDGCAEVEVWLALVEESAGSVVVAVVVGFPLMSTPIETTATLASVTATSTVNCRGCRCPWMWPWGALPTIGSACSLNRPSRNEAFDPADFSSSRDCAFSSLSFAFRACLCLCRESNLLVRCRLAGGSAMAGFGPAATHKPNHSTSRSWVPNSVARVISILSCNLCEASGGDGRYVSLDCRLHVAAERGARDQ